MRKSKAVAAAFLAMLLAGCGSSTKTSTPASVPVRISPVERIQVGNATKYSASIVPNQQIDLVFKSGGYVASMMRVKSADGRIRPVDVGDRVKEGQVLASVRPSEYQDRITQAKADLAKANAGYEQARLSFDRAQVLFNSGSATKPEYDQAKAQLDASAAGVEAGKAQISLANTQLRDSVLQAPRSGWIAKRNIDVGSLVGPSSVAFSLIDTHLVRVVFGVPDTTVQSVRLGQELRISTDVGGEVAGKVTSIAPAADPKSRVYSIEVTLANPTDRLKPGMIASLALGEAHPREVTVVPLSAVLRSTQNPNGFRVMMAESSGGGLVARSREIQIGDAYGNSLSVTSGLQPGDRVITTGATLVHEGDRVEPLP